MTAPPLFTLVEGTGRLVVSVPHAGTFLPTDLLPRLTTLGRAGVDTDWHMDRLYAFAGELGATLLTATHSRTVVDLNRSPAGGALYPGQAETTICPAESFAGEPLYQGPPPDGEEVARRVARYWSPYHEALAAQLARVRALHGAARLLDGHSIRSRVPRLFEGVLPDLNFGTDGGRTARPELIVRAQAATSRAGFSQVLDGRFRGGYITRQYGCPRDGVDAIQLEVAQSAYLDEAAPATFDAARAARLARCLRAMVEALLQP